MKKIIYSAMAVAMLATTSCKDDFAESFVGDQATVEFSISTPEIGTRAYSDGMTATNLQYAVYEVQVEGENKTLTYLEDLTVTDATIKGSTTVNLELTTGESYAVIFWAAAPQAPYTVDFEDMEMTVDYSAEKTFSNDESRDAFYAYKEFTVSGAQTETIELKRPFAQLNIGTEDYEEAKNANYIPTQSYVKVTNIYSTLDLVEGEVSNPVAAEFNYADIAKGETFPVDNATYDYLAMNYLLVAKDKELVNVDFKYTNGSKEHTRTVGSVPVQRNYRTNIYGKLLTSEVDVNVEIKPGFDGDENKEIVEVATVTELQTAIANPNVGEVVLTSDIEMSDILVIGAPSNNPAPTRSGAVAASRNLVIDGNGKTLTYTGKGVDARAITVESTANGTNLTLKNLTVNCISSYCQRGINYNTNGTLKLDGVTVKGTNVTYALNLPGSSDGANVTINNSSLTGNIALNVWGENATINATGSHFTSVDNSDAENYSAIVLNSDGTTIANGTTVNIDGGSITAKDEKGKPSYAVRNSTATGEVNVSETTSVVGTIANPVAILTYANTDQFYSFATLQAAIDFAKDGETITLIRDITMKAEQGTGYGKAGIVVAKNITIDGNGKKLTVNDAWNTWDCAIAAKSGTIKNLTVSGAMRGIFMPGANGDVYIDNVIFDNVIYTFNSDAGNKNYGVYISNSTLNGWTSHSDVHKEVVYTNCSFGQGNGYAFCRPYGPTTFAGCDFAAGFEVDAIGVVTFEDCTIGGVALTEGNLATLVIDGIGNATVK